MINWLKIKYNRTKLANPFVNKYKLQIDNDFFPFFIVGSGRSGNTLLRRILNNHSAFFIPPETYVLGKVIKSFKLYSNISWEYLVEIVYSSFELHPEFKTFRIDSLIELKKEMIIIPEEKRSLDILLNEFYLFYAKKHKINKLKWGDKTPLNTFSIRELKEVFPNAKFVHIIRNPFDSIYSYVNSGIYDNLKDAAKRWVISVTLARKYNNDLDNYIELYYEDLVTLPEREIQRICNFLDVDFEQNMLINNNQFLGDVDNRNHHKNVIKPINTSSIGKGINNLTDDNLKLIKSILIKNNNKYLKDILKKYKINRHYY